jgi:hypothetical protein
MSLSTISDHQRHRWFEENDVENKSYKKAIVVEMIFEANESII